MSENLNELRDAALHYASLGWRVMPIRPGGKAPITAHGVKDATTDAAQISAWWDRTPFANVAIALGRESGLTALDLDVGHKPGVDGVSNWLKLAEGRSLPVTPQTRTGGGGGHLLFKHTDRFSKATVGFAPGVDSRNDGLYVIAPPSIHPNGKPYEWIVSPDQSALADFPEWLAPLKAGNLAGILDPNAKPGQLPEAPVVRCMAYLATVERAVSGSGGHNATFRAAAEIARFGITGSKAWDCMTWFNANKCDPPWTEKELRHKLESARQTVDQAGAFGKRLDEGREPAPAYTMPAGAYGSPENPAKSATKDHARGVGQLEVIRMSDVVMKDVKWLWPKRIACGAVTLLAGVGGGGKGTLTMDVTARITKGRAWPDGGTPDTGTVILISAEDSECETIGPRLYAADADMRKVIKVKSASRIDKGGKEHREGFTLNDLPQLELLVRQTSDCKLVIIDPIGSYLGGATDSFRDEQVRDVMGPLAKLAETFGVAVLVVCHYRKSESLVADDKIMGSRAFTALARNVLHVMRDETGNRSLLLAGKTNNSKPADGLAFVMDEVVPPGLTGQIPVIKWQGSAPFTADQWLANCADQRKPGPKPTKTNDAVEFLNEFFKDRMSAPASEVIDAAKNTGIGESTLKIARKILNIGAWRDATDPNSAWAWSGGPALAEFCETLKCDPQSRVKAESE